MATRPFFEIKIIGENFGEPEERIHHEVTATEERVYKIFDNINAAYVLTKRIKEYQTTHVLLQYVTIAGGIIYYNTWEKKKFKT